MQENELEELVTSQQGEIEALRRRLGFFSSMIEVSAIISSTLELDELIRRVLETSQRVMGSEASNLMLIDEHTGRLECKVALGEVSSQLKGGFSLEIGQGIAGWVAQTGEALVVPDVSKDRRFFSGVDRKTGFVTRSILCAPLVAQNRVIGVAEVVNRADGKNFGEEDLKLFETFCRGVAVAVQNAQMHSRLLQTQLMEQQLEMASTIQQGFLPRSFSRKTENRFEIAARNLPASMVGGDFYDCIELRPGLFGLTIGDVSGKGVPAALYMARLLSDFRFNAHQAVEPGPTMRVLNRLLTERSQQGMFVTMVYMTLDTSSGELRFVNAGHLPPYLCKGRGVNLQQLRGGEGIPLGIQDPSDFNEGRIILEHGDTLVLFSDGVMDAKNPAGETFKLDGIEKVLRSSRGSASGQVDRIVEAVLGHCEAEKQFDDITVLVLKWLG